MKTAFVVVLIAKKNKYLVSGMLFNSHIQQLKIVFEYDKQNKVAYTSINMNNFSTIVGTGKREICITQISLNIFKFLGSFNCDECLQRL